MDRRTLLTGAAAAAAWARTPAAAQANGDAVVFLSRSSNTRMLAGDLSRRLQAPIFEIRPRDPWPEDYDEMVAWASRWRESGETLSLDSVPDLSGFQRVFLGFPIWGMALPAPVRSLLTQVDLSGKTVLPLVTHGGYGTGSAIESLQSLAPSARFAPAFVLQCDQERDNLDAMHGWLDGL